MPTVTTRSSVRYTDSRNIIFSEYIPAITQDNEIDRYIAKMKLNSTYGIFGCNGRTEIMTEIKKKPMMKKISKVNIAKLIRLLTRFDNHT